MGKSTKAGCRNVVRKPEDETRIFGAPTIRTDIPFKEKRSIADYNVSFKPQTFLIFKQFFFLKLPCNIIFILYI